MRRALDGEWFDVIVIGGGINGIAIARECARGGKRTLLLEQNDFASGTTSRSTRIIHGGLRYLEYGELSLVRESLRERQALLRERPHLVRRLSFLLALRPGERHSALAVRAGLWLYGAFAHSKPAPVPEEAAKLERLLDSDQSLAIFHYEDAQCEFPEHLAAEWLMEGVGDGMVARNHAPVLDVERRDGAVHGVMLRDLLTGDEYSVQTRKLVNATGPWADRLCANFRRDRPMIGGLRGSHIVVRRFSGAPNAAVYTEAVDGRPIFLVPWNGLLLLGTTEVRDDGDPDRTQPSEEEIEYLVSSVHRLFPGAKVQRSDIVYAFAGVRPLPHAPGKEESAISRRSYIIDHAQEGAAGMMSIVGGKLTTAAALAREVARELGIAAADPAPVDLPCPWSDGIESALTQWSQQMARLGGLNEKHARAMAEWHCRRALPIARLAGSDERLRLPLCDHCDHVVAEAVEAVSHEYAVTLADILLRRVPVALGACWSPDCSRQAAERAGVALGWDQRRIATELEQFEEERSRFLVKVSTVAESVAQ